MTFNLYSDKYKKIYYDKDYNLENKVIKDPYLMHRSYFPAYLNKLNLHGIGVEIGVKRGHFSKILLDNWDCEKIYLIDPWEEQENKTYDEKHTYNEDFEKTKEQLKNYEKKYEIIRKYSHEAYSYFKDNSIDFIYIDGNHSYEAVKKDLELWYPKLRKGGVLAGDDYNFRPIEKMNDGYIFGVTKAVNEFCDKIKKNVSLQFFGDWFYEITDTDFIIPSRNWYFIK
jgi:hypothetical protein